LDAEFEFSRGHLVAMTAVFAPRPGYRLDAEAFAERLLVHLTRAYGPGHVDLDNDLWHRRYTFAAKGAEATLEVNSWESVSLRVVNESCCLFGRGPPR
ncbi:MAG TPA: hypothetical protein VK454_13895, partial [Myxococcaceae bacterium]|nr:hypothetical protein [Myxococcaceae bacterium]